VEWARLFLVTRTGEPLVLWRHQAEELRDTSRFIVHQDGCEVGKTVCIVVDALHFAFITQGGLGLIVAPLQGHLDTIIDEIEHQISHSPDLRDSIARTPSGRLKIKRKPYFQVEFSSGSVLYFRPAGTDGSAYDSLHVHRIWVDQAATIPERAWQVLFSRLLPGGRIKVYSYPDGRRDTTYYRLTKSKRWKLYRWPSWISPLWSREREREKLEQYGGKNTPGWQHMVAGEHGAPSYGAFNLEAFFACQKDIPEYRLVEVPSDLLEGVSDEREAVAQLASVLGSLCGEGGVRYWLGVDAGYTNDPSELGILREVDGALRLVVRIHCERLPYPYLADLIALLDERYRFAGIGIDKGGNGLSVVQELTSREKYAELNLSDRVVGFDFGGSLTVGLSDDGKPVKRWVKEYLTDLINRALTQKRLELPKRDHALEDQITAHTYTLSDRRVVYSKGNDHIVDMLRCALGVRAVFVELGEITLQEEVVSVSPRLTKPLWG